MKTELMATIVEILKTDEVLTIPDQTRVKGKDRNGWLGVGCRGGVEYAQGSAKGAATTKWHAPETLRETNSHERH